MKKLKHWLRYLRGYFPSNLPKGSKEFSAFTDSILEIYNLPPMDSYRHAIASMIMHLGPTTASKSKIYFAKSIQKAMANQVAFEKIQEFKEAEAKKEKEAEAALSEKEAPAA